MRLLVVFTLLHNFLGVPLFESWLKTPRLPTKFQPRGTVVWKRPFVRSLGSSHVWLAWLLKFPTLAFAWLLRWHKWIRLTFKCLNSTASCLTLTFCVTKVRVSKKGLAVKTSGRGCPEATECWSAGQTPLLPWHAFQEKSLKIVVNASESSSAQVLTQ